MKTQNIKKEKCYLSKTFVMHLNEKKKKKMKKKIKMKISELLLFLLHRNLCC